MKYLFQKIKAFFIRPKNNVFQIPKQLVPYTRLFGSRKWGGYLPTSDIDLMACKDDFQAILNTLRDLRIDYALNTNHYLPGGKITFFINNFRYEITILLKSEYTQQYLICSIMDVFMENYPNSEKSFRICYFEFIKKFLKNKATAIPKDLYITINQHYPELLI